MMLLSLSQTRLALPLYTCLRKCSSETTSGNDLSWSTGEKERPLSWRHLPQHWYKRKPSVLKPHFLDPKDPLQKYPFKRKDGGIQHFNFVYYPRFPDKEDPPITPTKLFLVMRTQSMLRRPYWETNIMRQIGLHDIDGRGNRMAICKNIPEVNAMLWQVKHLVEILPLKIPENLPKDANPLHCFITEEGELKYNPTRNITEEDLEIDFSEKEKFGRSWVDKQTRIIFNKPLIPEF